MRDADGRMLFYEGTLTDITAAHELSQQLSYEASHDALTGLSNRREFELRLQRALEMSQATGAEHAMLYLDLDRFKTVNDTCGHVAGDELLRQLGEVLQQRVRANDVVARLGGDEFGVLLHNCSPRTRSRSPTNLLQDRRRIRVRLGHEQVHARRQHRPGRDRLALQAPHAGDERGRLGLLLRPRTSGRHRVAVYQEDTLLLERRHGEMDWVARAKRALVENRLFLEAQEIRPLSQPAGGTPRLPHYELLLRMRDESGRVVPPGAFLPAVERYNLSVRYDRWVIATALEWVADARRGLQARLADLHQPLARQRG